MTGRIKAPQLAKIACYRFEGWIVGGAARVIAGISDDPIKDWDILVPIHHWAAFSLNIPPHSQVNHFGGIKVTEAEFKLDVWAGDIGWFLGHIPLSTQRVAFCPSTQTLLEAKVCSGRF